MNNPWFWFFGLASFGISFCALEFYGFGAWLLIVAMIGLWGLSNWLRMGKL